MSVCFFCIMVFVIFVISRFGFEGRSWILIALSPGHCLLFTFIQTKDNIFMGFMHQILYGDC